MKGVKKGDSLLIFLFYKFFILIYLNKYILLNIFSILKTIVK